VCSVYTAGIDGYCEECWHDKACHLLSEDEIRADERAKVLAEIRGRLGL
jgi:pentatricopeptide repeat protein